MAMEMCLWAKAQEKTFFDVIYYPTVNSFRGRERQMVVKAFDRKRGLRR